MTREEKIEDIKMHPEDHHHSFDALTRCCVVDGAVDLSIMQAHQDYAPAGTNGGVRCDVTEGPCACGGWH